MECRQEFRSAGNHQGVSERISERSFCDSGEVAVVDSVRKINFTIRKKPEDRVAADREVSQDSVKSGLDGANSRPRLENWPTNEPLIRTPGAAAAASATTGGTKQGFQKLPKNELSIGTRGVVLGDGDWFLVSARVENIRAISSACVIGTCSFMVNGINVPIDKKLLVRIVNGRFDLVLLLGISQSAILVNDYDVDVCKNTGNIYFKNFSSYRHPECVYVKKADLNSNSSSEFFDWARDQGVLNNSEFFEVGYLNYNRSEVLSVRAFASKNALGNDGDVVKWAQRLAEKLRPTASNFSQKVDLPNFHLTSDKPPVFQ